MSDITFTALYLPLLLSALALIICIISVLIIKAYIKRRTSREWILQEGILTEIRDEVNKLLKSIDETTDRDITLITEREKNLRALIAEVEKRLKVYMREMERRPQIEETYKNLLSSGSQPVSSEADSGFRPSSAASEGTYVDLGKLRYRLKRQEAVTASAAETPVETRPPEPKPLEPTPLSDPVSDPAASPSSGDLVNSLLKAGISASVIASRLGLSITEVEFKAALLERRGK